MFYNSYLQENKFFLFAYCIVWLLGTYIWDMACHIHPTPARIFSLEATADWVAQSVELSHLLFQSELSTCQIFSTMSENTWLYFGGIWSPINQQTACWLWHLAFTPGKIQLGHSGNLKVNLVALPSGNLFLQGLAGWFGECFIDQVLQATEDGLTLMRETQHGRYLCPWRPY